MHTGRAMEYAELKYPHDEARLARESWLDSELGRYLLDVERRLIERKLPELFGFHLMQLGISRQTMLFESSVIRHKFALAGAPGGPGVSALAEPEQLPIESDSVDVVILHHALEFSDNPHQLLREAARVIVPHGSLLIVGFNPWSAFGLRAVAGRPFGNPVWGSKLLGARRVADWLALLDFALDSTQYGFHSLPLNHAGMLQRLSGLDRLGEKWSLPWGSVYVIHACKQVSPLIPLRQPRRRARPRIAAVPLATPSARNTTLH